MRGQELVPPQASLQGQIYLWTVGWLLLSHRAEGADAILQQLWPCRCDINYDATSCPIINNPHLCTGRSISRMASSITCLAPGLGWLIGSAWTVNRSCLHVALPGWQSRGSEMTIPGELDGRCVALHNLATEVILHLLHCNGSSHKPGQSQGGGN